MDVTTADDRPEPDEQQLTLDDERDRFNQRYERLCGGAQAFGTLGAPPLPPLFVPGAVLLDDTADIGINRMLVQPAPQGLIVQVQPYPDMLAGDIMEIFLHLEGQAGQAGPVKTATLGKGREGRVISLIVPAEKVEQGRLELYWRLTRAALQGEVSREVLTSAPLSVLCVLSLPAGPDLAPDEPWHSELHAPRVADQITTAALGEFVQVSIDPYPSMAAGDTLRLHVGLEPFDYRVQAADVGQVVTVDVAANIFERQGNAQALALDYQVIDKVGNVSEKWSARALVQARLNSTELDAPRVNDATGPQVIDTATLTDAGASLLVWAGIALFQPGDRIEVQCTGIGAVGQRIEMAPAAQTVTELGKAYLFTLPAPELRRLARGLLKVGYRLYRGDQLLQHSLHRYVDVLGEVEELSRPKLVQANAGVLDPTLIRCTVTIAYPGLAMGDWVKLCWHGVTAQQYSHVWEMARSVSRNEERRQQISFTVTAEHIAVLDGGSLQLRYQVSNQSLPGALESPRLWVQVGALQAELAPPVIEGSGVDGALPEAALAQGVKVQVSPDIALASDDEVIVKWLCATAAGSVEGQAHERSLEIPQAVLKASVGQVIDASYTVTSQNDGRVRLSRSARTRIVPNEPMVLHAPVSLQGGGASLDPYELVDGAQFQVAYQGMVAEDEVVLTMVGNPSWTSPVMHVEYLKPLVITVATSWLKDNAGNPIRVGYRVSRKGQASQDSPWLNLQVRDNLAIPTQLLELKGLSVKAGWPASGQHSVGNTAKRVASGGVPPYSYTSSNPAVASVTAAGMVRGNSNGQATITATDKRGSTVSYQVKVSNVFRLLGSYGRFNHTQAVDWMTKQGGEPVTARAIADLKRVYGPTLPGNVHTWLCEKNGCGGAGFAFYHYVNQAVHCADYNNTNISAAWCLQRT
nr:Ig-like domain-containing protein [uncultured Pseudomonas sp.]